MWNVNFTSTGQRKNRANFFSDFFVENNRPLDNIYKADPQQNFDWL